MGNWKAWYKTKDGRILYEAVAAEKYKALSKLKGMLPEDIEDGDIHIGGAQIMTHGSAGTGQ